MDYIKIRFKKGFDQQGSMQSRAFDDMFRAMNPLFSLSDRSLKPQIDVFETQKEIYVLVEIAGVDPEDLDVEISRKTIKIAGRRRQMQFSEKGAFRLAEVQYGPFERAFILPCAIDTDRVSASYTNGMLHIRLEKIRSNQTFTIPISDG
ncbi:MAG: Hsp20/alpha crystallin family protein [Desulfobacterales bacterium]